MYENYRIARNKAWETLIKYDIKALPINLEHIANKANITIDLYSKSNFTQLLSADVLSGDGFIIKDRDNKRIFINDKINNRNRRRFTLAHELGHGILNHNIDEIHYRNSEIDNQNDIQETQANIFARDLLMPSIVLAALNIHTPDEIMKICDVSYQSAIIRAERMEELYKRKMFNKHPLEKQVYKQFENFIRLHNSY